MKPWLFVPALAICISTQTGCKDAEKERQKFVADSTATAQRIADSLEAASPIDGAPFGCSPQTAETAIRRFNDINNYRLRNFEYREVVPHYFHDGLMEIEIIGQQRSWSDFGQEYLALASCISMLNSKYGEPSDKDTSFHMGGTYDRMRVIGWKKGDKNIGVRLVSDNNNFLFYIDIVSEEVQKNYIHDVMKRTEDPL